MAADIFIALGVSVALNLFFFIFAFILKTDTFTDITYASTFFITSLLIMVITSSYNVVSYILLAMVGLWSLRLGTFLFVRIRKTKVDHRFDKMRNDFWKFGAFWLLQAFTVWLVNLQTYIGFINSVGEFKYVSIVFLVLALGFLTIEAIADIQKYKWNTTHKNQFICHGLWKVSRHPNYFGEYTFWWALAGFTLMNHYAHINLIGLIGPLYITFTLYKVSGLPLLEKRSFQTFGNDPKYIDYLNKTPTVIPFIGKKGYKTKWKS